MEPKAVNLRVNCFLRPKKGKKSIMNKATIIGRLDTEAQLNDNIDNDPKCRFKLAVCRMFYRILEQR